MFLTLHHWAQLLADHQVMIAMDKSTVMSYNIQQATWNTLPLLVSSSGGPISVATHMHTHTHTEHSDASQTHTGSRCDSRPDVSTQHKPRSLHSGPGLRYGRISEVDMFAHIAPPRHVLAPQRSKAVGGPALVNTCPYWQEPSVMHDTIILEMLTSMKFERLEFKSLKLIFFASLKANLSLNVKAKFISF